jgi:transposase
MPAASPRQSAIWPRLTACNTDRLQDWPPLRLTACKAGRLDVAMLERMDAGLELKTRPPRSEALLELKELHLAREASANDRTAVKNRGKALPRHC